MGALVEARKRKVADLLSDVVLKLSLAGGFKEGCEYAVTFLNKDGKTVSHQGPRTDYTVIMIQEQIELAAVYSEQISRVVIWESRIGAPGRSPKIVDLPVEGWS